MASDVETHHARRPTSEKLGKPLKPIWTNIVIQLMKRLWTLLYICTWTCMVTALTNQVVILEQKKSGLLEVQRNPFGKKLNHHLSSVGQSYNISSTQSAIVPWCPDWSTDKLTFPTAEVMWRCSSLFFTLTSAVTKAGGFSPKRRLSQLAFQLFSIINFSIHGRC